MLTSALTSLPRDLSVMFHSSSTLIYCVIFSYFALIGHAKSLLPLTDLEADTIIQQRETSQQEAKAARIAELEEATVKSEGRGVLPNGQKVIIREVEPPASVVLSLVETAPESRSTEPLRLSLEHLTQLESFANKDYQTIMLSATVYDHSVSRLSWRHLSDEFIAFTNADFNYLRGTHSLDVDNTNFTFFMGIGNTIRDANPYGDEVVPSSATFSRERSEYLLLQGDPDNAEALAGLETLLKHYDANLPELKVAHQRREALAAAQKRYNAKHPEEPEDFIMQFWVPERANGKAVE